MMDWKKLSNQELAEQYKSFSFSNSKTEKPERWMKMFGVWMECVNEIVDRFIQAAEIEGLYNSLHDGVECWYWDEDSVSPEKGKILGVNWVQGKIDSFGVEFDDGDFDEFSYEALGCSIFLSKLSLYRAMGKGEGE